ncbi:MAG: endonuclease domain-containing protein, partial [Firmicutes bacterium]|nr:endonuclease domain-containing protein [Bacillota bacterium]
MEQPTRMLESDGRLRPCARELRNNATEQETDLWYGFLRQRPERWGRQRVIGEFIVDFYCPKAKLVIELDGMQHYTPQGLAHDEERSAYLEAQGLTVLRFKNQEVDETFHMVCRKIAETTEMWLSLRDTSSPRLRAEQERRSAIHPQSAEPTAPSTGGSLG